MAEKKEAKKSEEKMKIIREIPSEFKEVEKEEENIEEEQEEENIEEDFSDFVDFSSFAPFSPPSQASSIQSQQQNQELLEQQLENTPGRKKEEGREETKIYNAPNYTSGYEDRIKYEEAEKIRRGIQIKDTEEFKPREQERVELRPMREEFREGKIEIAEREIRKYQELERAEERRMPFHRGERKRERVLK